jgi:hypothetical protein
VTLIGVAGSLYGWLARRTPALGYTHCSLRTAYHSLLTTHNALLTTHYSLLTAYCLLLTPHFSLLTAYHPLLTTDCYEVYPLGVRAHGQRPDAETERDLRLLFRDGFKELHAEVPPEPGAQPLLLLALTLALALTLTPKP